MRDATARMPSERTGGDASGADEASAVVASAGHCMSAPAVWDARDPFAPLVGKRSEMYGANRALLSLTWLPRGLALTGSDSGRVEVHDFYNEERVGSRHTRSTSKRWIPWRRSTSAKKEEENRYCLEAGAVWAVDATLYDARGVTLVAAATGNAGAHVGLVHAGMGNMTYNVRHKDAMRRAGAAIDLTVVGGTNRDRAGASATLFGQGSDTPGSENLPGASAVRTVAWWNRDGRGGGDSEECLLCWGDDAGFLRFQRFDRRELNRTAAELHASEEYT